jgi:methionine synthase I (cobalamin-dependent)
VNKLVSAGADIFAVNTKGQTALQIASDDVAQLLQQLQQLRERSARSASGGV